MCHVVTACIMTVVLIANITYLISLIISISGSAML